KTASLTVQLDAPANRRWSASLPIEVRDARKYVRVARGVSEDKLAVPAGNYVVTAILPDGQQIAAEQIVEVAAGGDKIVPLSLANVEVPPSLESKAASWSDAVRDFAQPLAQHFSQVTHSIITGNWLAGLIATGSAGAYSRAAAS